MIERMDIGAYLLCCCWLVGHAEREFDGHLHCMWCNTPLASEERNVDG